jgi:hypothetical protein
MDKRQRPGRRLGPGLFKDLSQIFSWQLISALIEAVSKWKAGHTPAGRMFTKSNRNIVISGGLFKGRPVIQLVSFFSLFHFR